MSRDIHAEVARLRIELADERRKREEAERERDAFKRYADGTMKSILASTHRALESEQAAHREKERALDEANAGAAALRQALEGVGDDTLRIAGLISMAECVLQHYPQLGDSNRVGSIPGLRSAIDDAKRALATDAGRAMLDELTTLRSLFFVADMLEQYAADNKPDEWCGPAQALFQAVKNHRARFKQRVLEQEGRRG